MFAPKDLLLPAALRNVSVKMTPAKKNGTQYAAQTSVPTILPEPGMLAKGIR
jgi:hypothetical protein